MVIASLHRLQEGVVAILHYGPGAVDALVAVHRRLLHDIVGGHLVLNVSREK